MSNSTLTAKPAKPRDDFPLFAHDNGWWAKKVRGKLRYFSKWREDPKGEAALNKWLDEKDDLLAGRTPRKNRDGLTVKDLCDHFLTEKERQRNAGELTRRSFDEYFATCKVVGATFGKDRLVDDLAAEDFQGLRGDFAKRYGLHRLGNEVQRTRTVFKYGYDTGLIDKPVRFGPTFKRPSKRTMRQHRQQSAQKNGKRMFDASTLRTIINAASQPLKAMILLGINCGFGNYDCGSLPLSAVDLDKGWHDFPRPKTSMERRCPLWPETIKALKEAIATRPNAKAPEHRRLMFVTKYGKSWAKDTPDSPVAKEFRKLVDSIDEAAAKAAEKKNQKSPPKVYRPGVGFYALRHTFETIAGGTRDQVAVDFIMGHVDSSMAAEYRESIEDERLLHVTNLVRKWLFNGAKKKR